MTAFYKVLDADREPLVGAGRWPEPGTWTEPVTNLVRCASGYHVVPGAHLVDRLGPAIWTVEIRGERLVYETEIVAETARLVTRTRWNEQRARLFACDCAARVLRLFDAARPGDGRPRRAVEVARRYAWGGASDGDLAAAADWAARAARVAAEAAAGAARDAERAWQTARLTAYLWDEQPPDPVPLPERTPA